MSRDPDSPKFGAMGAYQLHVLKFICFSKHFCYWPLLYTLTCSSSISAATDIKLIMVTVTKCKKRKMGKTTKHIFWQENGPYSTSFLIETYKKPEMKILVQDQMFWKICHWTNSPKGWEPLFKMMFLQFCLLVLLLS